MEHRVASLRQLSFLSVGVLS